MPTKIIVTVAVLVLAEEVGAVAKTTTKPSLSFQCSKRLHRTITKIDPSYDPQIHLAA